MKMKMILKTFETVLCPNCEFMPDFKQDESTG